MAYKLLIIYIFLICNVTIQAKEIFYYKNLNVCKACHGKHFEKSALNASSIVKNFNIYQIMKALNGFKEKTYGGISKQVMEYIVKHIRKQDIEKFAKKIYYLNHQKYEKINLNRCFTCHGEYFEKKALGISKRVNTLSIKSIKKKLQEYQHNKKYKSNSYFIMEQEMYKYKDKLLFKQLIKKIKSIITKKLVNNNFENKKKKILRNILLFKKCSNINYDKDCLKKYLKNNKRIYYNYNKKKVRETNGH